MKRRTITICLLICLLSMLFAACGASESSGNSGSGVVYASIDEMRDALQGRYVLDSESDSLDQQIAVDGDSIIYHRNIANLDDLVISIIEWDIKNGIIRADKDIYVTNDGNLKIGDDLYFRDDTVIIEESVQSAMPESINEEMEAEAEVLPEIEFELITGEDSRNGYPMFILETNLPDGTEFDLRLESLDEGIDYDKSQKLVIQEGVAVSELFELDGHELNDGKYRVTATMVDANKQPESVQAVIGAFGENMTGKRVEEYTKAKKEYKRVLYKKSVEVNIAVPYPAEIEEAYFNAIFIPQEERDKLRIDFETNLPYGAVFEVVIINTDTNETMFTQAVSSKRGIVRHGMATLMLPDDSTYSEIQKMLSDYIDGNYMLRLTLDGEILSGQKAYRVMTSGKYLYDTWTFYDMFDSWQIEYAFTVHDGVFSNITIKEDDDIEEDEYVPTSKEFSAKCRASKYLDVMPFSYSGLIAQLEFEGYTTSDATYGVDHCGADWEQQALEKAKDYLDLMEFSRSRLIDQLEFDGFTTEEATYAADELGL